MTEAVLADAQFGTAKVLKPFNGFEAVYQGRRGNVPIAIPGNLEKNAGKPGFSSNLIEAASIPFGSKILLWIPTIRDIVGTSTRIIGYEYKFIFRLRNLRDFQQDRRAYHFPRQSLGEGQQFVIPAAKKVILFEGPPDNAFGATLANSSRTSFETIQIATNLDVPPRTPSGGTADLEQGLGLGLGLNRNAIFNPVSMDSEGDEMIILVTKKGSDEDEGSVWNFEEDPTEETDKGFSDFFGIGTGAQIRDTGIYLFSGSNP